MRLPKGERRLLVPWEPERVAAVRAALPERYRAVLDVAAGCGLRQGEVFGLAVRDIDFLRRSVHVRRQIRLLPGMIDYAPAKFLHERTVPLPETTSLALAAHIAGHQCPEITLPWRGNDQKLITERLVFASGRGGPVNRNSFNRTWRNALRTAGVPAARENGMHALRHAYASMLLAGGVDIRTVSEYLGHADPGFTLRTYCHLLEDAPTGHALPSTLRSPAQHPLALCWPSMMGEGARAAQPRRVVSSTSTDAFAPLNRRLAGSSGIDAAWRCVTDH